MAIRTFLATFTLILIAAHAVGATPVSVEIIGPAGTRRLSAADIAALPRSKVTISDHGVDATFEGPTFANLLGLGGAAPSGGKPHADQLRKYMLVEAADSYRALFALAELDPAFTDRLVILADTRDGKPLPAKEGPFRVIVQGERRQARCVRQVTRITIGTIR